MIVVGAGMAGLLAASMLRQEVSSVIEYQPSLPNNHTALLRFRSSVVGDVTGIPFKEVKVMKAISPWKNPVADALSYSFKCTGKYSLRSSISGNGDVETRYIAPSDFIQKLGEQVGSKIAYGRGLSDLIRRRAVHPSDEPIISTIPMPALMHLLKYRKKVEFGHRAGGTISFNVPNVNVCATLYFPDPSVGFYRGSITGNRVILETSNEKMIRAINGKKVQLSKQEYALAQINRVTNALGIGQGHVALADLDGEENKQLDLFFGASKYAKLIPIPENDRKRFILWASEKHNIYSLGRFATWRPTLLLDDVVNDVRVIQSLANGNVDASYLARIGK